MERKIEPGCLAIVLCPILERGSHKVVFPAGTECKVIGRLSIADLAKLHFRKKSPDQAWDISVHGVRCAAIERNLMRIDGGDDEENRKETETPRRSTTRDGVPSV